MEMSRRGFVQGAACIGAAGLGTTACQALAEEAQTTTFTYADTIPWNAEYDVVVVGFGGAGGVASVYAADNGARVLLCDAAPEGNEGGNTRYAAQMCVSGMDAEKLYSYYKDGLYWHFDIDDDTLRAYTDGLANMEELLTYIDAEEPVIMLPNGTIVTPEYPEYMEIGGDTVVEWFVHKGMFDSGLWRTIRSAPVIMLPNGTIVTPEYPEYMEIGGDTVVEWFVHKGMFDSGLWRTIRSAVEKRSDAIDVWLESPALHMIQDPETKTVVGVEIQRNGESVLVHAKNGVEKRSDAIDVWLESPALHMIQDPETKTVVGVEIQRNGESVLVHAKNGVVLACGGFENNPAMIQDYIGAARLTPFGSLYNKGDGIKFGREVGADMWHMEAYESIGILAGNAWATTDGRLAFEKNPAGGNPLSLESGDYGIGSIILVGDDGSRFIDENANSRHGHVYSCGVWRMPIANWAPHLIFDQTQYDVLAADGYLTEDRVASLVSANTPQELAELIGANPEILERTISDFNFFAENGRDYQLNRDPASMRPFDGGVFYAAEFRPGVLNTQGGPRRNGNAEVIGVDGNPIPHLYSAGELGGICAFQYNSGGNLGECMVSGKAAGIGAATPKDPLPAMATPQAVQTSIIYNPGDANDLNAEKPHDYEAGEGEYIGVSGDGIGGDIVVKVAYADGAIQSVEVLEQNETPQFGGAALEELPAMVVEANSTAIDGVAGSTITSKAFFSAVEDAIAQA